MWSVYGGKPLSVNWNAVINHTAVRATAVVVFLATIITCMVAVVERYAKAEETKRTLTEINKDNQEALRKMQLQQSATMKSINQTLLLIHFNDQKNQLEHDFREIEEALERNPDSSGLKKREESIKSELGAVNDTLKRLEAVKIGGIELK